MKLQVSHSDDPEINLTPLLDVVFLLLIFFMVTTTFQKEAQLKIQVPQASQEPAPPPADELEVVIDARGHYYLGGQEVVNTKRDTLRAAIEKAAGDRDKQRPVLIRADGRTPHQSVVTAMDVLGELGYTHLSIATTRGEEDSS